MVLSVNFYHRILKAWMNFFVKCLRIRYVQMLITINIAELKIEIIPLAQTEETTRLVSAASLEETISRRGGLSNKLTKVELSLQVD